MKDIRRQFYSDSEIEAQDKWTDQKEAMGLLMKLDHEFLKSKIEYRGLNNLPVETSEEYFPVENFFNKLCEKEKKSDPTFSIKVLANCEKDRIEDIIRKVKQLSEASYYTQIPSFKQALKYIEFLSIVGRIHKPPKAKIENLKEACMGSKEYEAIITWFISSGLIYPHNYFWKDQKKGSKSILVFYIKELSIKGYTKKLTQAQIKTIAENSFGFGIGIDTIKKEFPGLPPGMPEVPLFKK